MRMGAARHCPSPHLILGPPTPPHTPRPPPSNTPPPAARGKSVVLAMCPRFRPRRGPFFCSAEEPILLVSAGRVPYKSFFVSGPHVPPTRCTLSAHSPPYPPIPTRIERSLPPPPRAPDVACRVRSAPPPPLLSPIWLCSSPRLRPPGVHRPPSAPGPRDAIVPGSKSQRRVGQPLHRDQARYIISTGCPACLLRLSRTAVPLA